MAERDYPKGHPAAGDYAGEPYTPPRAPHAYDYDENHPAFQGKNEGPLDSPDGMRAAHNEREREQQDRQNIALPEFAAKDAGADEAGEGQGGPGQEFGQPTARQRRQQARSQQQQG